MRLIRSIVLLVCPLLLFANCKGVSDRHNGEKPYPRLGANFNEHIGEPAELSAQLSLSGVEWVRAFVHIPNNFLLKDAQGRISGVKENIAETYEGTRNFVGVKKISNESLKLIMSLKIPFDEYSHLVPAAGSSEMEYVLEACEGFLRACDLGANIDILVMGNEPEWENGGDVEDYVAFINIFADRLADWKVEYGWTFDVYAGALNRVSELEDQQTIKAVVSAVNSNPNIVGLDLHIHAERLEQCGDDLRDIREKYGVTKKIICTEFSMVRALDKYVDEPLGDWASQYGYSPQMKTYEWLNEVARRVSGDSPVTQEEFLSFFESRPGYPSGWYEEFYGQFVEYDVYCITGRFASLADGRSYRSTSRMWDLGAIYSSKFMGFEPGSELFLNPNPLVHPEFVKIKQRQKVIDKISSDGYSL